MGMGFSGEFFYDLNRILMGFLWDFYMIEWDKMMKQHMLL